jgi:hypothetical protein
MARTRRWIDRAKRTTRRSTESFFATLECELLQGVDFATRLEARMAVVSWIEGWSNPTVASPPSTTPAPRTTKGPSPLE